MERGGLDLRPDWPNSGNTGSRTAGVDGLTVVDVEEQVGVSGFLEDLRAQLKAGTSRPLPVRSLQIGG